MRVSQIFTQGGGYGYGGGGCDYGCYDSCCYKSSSSYYDRHCDNDCYYYGRGYDRDCHRGGLLGILG